MSAVWPSSLPQRPVADGYSESLTINTLSTPSDNGPGKGRRRGSRPTPIHCAFTMTGAQVVTLDAFIRDDLLGVRRFTLPHPRTGSPATARMVTTNGGEYYRLQPLGPDLWRVEIQMEML